LCVRRRPRSTAGLLGGSVDHRWKKCAICARAGRWSAGESPGVYSRGTITSEIDAAPVVDVMSQPHSRAMFRGLGSSEQCRCIESPAAWIAAPIILLDAASKLGVAMSAGLRTALTYRIRSRHRKGGEAESESAGRSEDMAKNSLWQQPRSNETRAVSITSRKSGPPGQMSDTQKILHESLASA